MFSNKKFFYLEMVIVLICMVISFYFIFHAFSLKSCLDQKTLDYENLLSEKLELEKLFLHISKDLEKSKNDSSISSLSSSDENINHLTNQKEKILTLSKGIKDSLEHVILVHENEFYQLSKKITQLRNQLEQIQESNLRQ